MYYYIGLFDTKDNSALTVTHVGGWLALVNTREIAGPGVTFAHVTRVQVDFSEVCIHDNSTDNPGDYNIVKIVELDNL